jgi:hypothetical protein
MGASLSAFLLYGFASNLPVLCLFAIFWGFFGLGFTSLWTRAITVIAKGDPISPPTIFGFLFMIRGICNVLSGPISSFLLQGAALPDARFGYGVKDYVSEPLSNVGRTAKGVLTNVCLLDTQPGWPDSLYWRYERIGQCCRHLLPRVIMLLCNRGKAISRVNFKTVVRSPEVARTYLLTNTILSDYRALPCHRPILSSCKRSS